MTTIKTRLDKLEKAARPEQTRTLFFTETGAGTGQYKGPDDKIFTRAELAELEKDPRLKLIILSLRREGDPI